MASAHQMCRIVTREGHPGERMERESVVDWRQSDDLP